MSNIINYVQKNTKTFKKDPFNELDSLLFSILSYCHFNSEYVGKKLEEISLTDEVLDNLTNHSLVQKELMQTLIAVCQNPRFKSATILDIVNKTEIETQMQFSATTFKVNGTIYIAYRGTTATTIGWKENFNMAYTDEVPSQYFAIKYFRKIKNQNKGKFYLGGHSKGGNLAWYVTLMTQDKNILRADNFDGPGFHNQKEKFDSKLLKLKDVCHKFIPEGSIVGLLQDDLIEDDICTVVKANGFAPLQHNVFTWEIENNHFVTTKLDSPSQLSWHAIANWLASLNNKDKEDFIEMIFLAISYSDGIYLKKLLQPKNAIKVAGKLFKSQKEHYELWQIVIAKFIQAYLNSSKQMLFNNQKDFISNIQTNLNFLSLNQRSRFLNNLIKGSKIKDDK